MTTSAGVEANLPPEQRRWTWEHPVGPRWLLCGDIGYDPDEGYDDFALALCAEVEGLFVDLPPRPRERFTLVGCTPDGALADLLHRLPAEALSTEQARVGYMYVAASPDTSPSWFGEELDAVVVLAQRPNTTMPGTVDVDLEGFVRLQDRTDEVERPDDVDDFVLKDENESPCGVCRDITGVFREQAAPLVPQVRLIGCQPEALLLTALGAVGQSTGASLESRRMYADVSEIAADGSVGRITGAAVFGTITGSEPSRLGAGLLDVTIDSFPREPLPAGVLDILEQWRTGRPPRKNLWAGYDRQLRHHWCGVALSRRSGEPDRPSGTTYDLDGRFVTDIEGFYCALGEAINGPGGYFGWNPMALNDCLRGGFGARTPFRLVWHDSAVAREHPVVGHDGRPLGPADLLDMFTAHDVEIDLR